MEKLTINQAMDLLEEGINKIQSSEDWINYLKIQSKFHTYSFSNTILILAQMPNATKVASFKFWKDLGRRIIADEQSIKIYAPRFKKNSTKKKTEKEAEIKTDDKEESHDSIILDEKDSDKSSKTVNGFYLAPVFDISQTTGPEIMTIAKKLEGSSDAADEIILGIESVIDIPVIYFDDDKKDSYFSEEFMEIGVNSELDTNHLAKCLVREYARYYIHDKYSDISDEKVINIISESTAFIVCKTLGLDTSDYSFSYVAEWSKGDIKTVKKVGSLMQGISKKIIQKVEEGLDTALVS